MRLGRFVPAPLKALLRPVRDGYRRRTIGLGRPRRGLDVVYHGTEYGGYAVPVGRLGPGTVSFCFGAGEDISFETELATRLGCRVHVFDPTPRSIDYCTRVIDELALPGGLLTFHPMGVWSSNQIMRFYAPREASHVSHSVVNLQHTEEYFEAQCYTPRALMEQLGVERVDLVKLNIEGAEYEVMAAMFDEEIRPETVCITFDELHTAIDGEARERMRGLVRRFGDEGYVLIDAQGPKATFHRAPETG